MSAKYAENDRIVVLHSTGQSYDARCVKAELRENPDTKKKEMMYLVHYNGWAKTWDEWLPDSRISKATSDSPVPAPENKRKQRLVSSAASSPRATPTPKRNKVEETGGKQRRQRDVDAVDVPTGMTIDITLPSELRKILVDDQATIVKGKKLVSLPRATTIASILNDFTIATAQDYDTTEFDVHQEIIKALIQLFDRLVGPSLLYAPEKAQFCSILKLNEDKSLTEIYGLEHLLRLLVKLPPVLYSFSNYTAEGQESVQRCIDALLPFLVTNLGKYYDKTYVTAKSVN